MSTSATPLDRLREIVREAKEPLFLLGDFESAGTPEEVAAGLDVLMREGTITRVGDDLYARMVTSWLTKEPVPEGTLQQLARIYARRVGAIPVPTAFEFEKLEGRHNQVSVGRTVGVDRPLDVELRWNDHVVKFEYVPNGVERYRALPATAFVAS